MKAGKDKRINHERAAIVSHYYFIKNGFLFLLFIYNGSASVVLETAEKFS